MGIVSQWRTQRQLGEPQWNPCPAQAARLGERGAVNIPCGPPTPTNTHTHTPPPPPTHTHTHKLETVEEVKKTSTHRCSSMQMYAGVHAYKHTLSLCHPPPLDSHTHLSSVGAQGDVQAQSPLCILPSFCSLPLSLSPRCTQNTECGSITEAACL